MRGVIEIKPEVVQDAIHVLTSSMCGLPSPSASFDLGKVDYITPRTLEGSVRDAIETILQMGASAYADQFREQFREQIRQEERVKLIDRLKA